MGGRRQNCRLRCIRLRSSGCSQARPGNSDEFRRKNIDTLEQQHGSDAIADAGQRDNDTDIHEDSGDQQKESGRYTRIREEMDDAGH